VLSGAVAGRTLWAWSDLHVGAAGCRQVVESVRPESERDWLIVAGDVAELAADVQWALGLLAGRYAEVIWTPGNHELWTLPRDPVRLRGEPRYHYLVNRLRDLGVVTPEDDFPLWPGPDGPVAIAPLFLLYDYTFRPAGAATSQAGLELAHARGIVSTDEFLLHPDPYPDRAAWCHARVELTRRRLDALDPQLALILVNHFPLIREPTLLLRHPEFALWCGTERTADWHRRYRAHTVVHGHLHIPRAITRDGVRFVEASLGYPQEWPARGGPAGPRPLLRAGPT
jgi:3',5'-cyclic AMP phosphodiesterase CpdA